MLRELDCKRLGLLEENSPLTKSSNSHFASASSSSSWSIWKGHFASASLSSSWSIWKGQMRRFKKSRMNGQTSTIVTSPFRSYARTELAVLAPLPGSDQPHHDHLLCAFCLCKIASLFPVPLFFSSAPLSHYANPQNPPPRHEARRELARREMVSTIPSPIPMPSADPPPAAASARGSSPPPRWVAKGSLPRCRLDLSRVWDRLAGAARVLAGDAGRSLRDLADP
jgi:hypothetical protein